MQNDVVRRAAKKFIKSVKGKIDFVSVEEYLRTLGYVVIFFNTTVGDSELFRYCLTEKATKTKAFTYNSTAKIIFIDNNVSSEDKTYLLYHETAHIVLGHLDYGRLSTKNSVLLDIEADTFVYEILNPKKPDVFMPLLFILVMVCGFAVGALTNRSNADVVPNETINSNIITQTDYNWVYITTTGTKFHTQNCTYTKDKDCARIERTEAEKLFQPCKVCNP